jgi:hypothetical protein
VHVPAAARLMASCAREGASGPGVTIAAFSGPIPGNGMVSQPIAHIDNARLTLFVSSFACGR